MPTCPNPFVSPLKLKSAFEAVPTSELSPLSLQAAFLAALQEFQDPFIVPPKKALGFDEVGDTNLIAGATTNLITLTLGVNERGRIEFFGQEVLDSPVGTAATGFTNLAWEIQVNGSAAARYVNNQVARLHTPRKVYVKIPKAGRVTVFVRNSHATTTFTIAAGITGWTFTEEG